MEHLEHNHILYELQYGFRRNRSCELQLTSLLIQSLSLHITYQTLLFQ